MSNYYIIRYTPRVRGSGQVPLPREITMTVVNGSSFRAPTVRVVDIPRTYFETPEVRWVRLRARPGSRPRSPPGPRPRLLSFSFGPGFSAGHGCGVSPGRGLGRRRKPGVGARHQCAGVDRSIYVSPGEHFNNQIRDLLKRSASQGSVLGKLMATVDTNQLEVCIAREKSFIFNSLSRKAEIEDYKLY